MAGVRLDWSDLNAGPAQEDGFRVYRSVSPLDVSALPAPIATLAANATFYLDNSAAGNTVYYYGVVAFKGAFERFAFVSVLSIAGGGGGAVEVDVSFLLSDAVVAGATGTVALDTGAAEGIKKYLVAIAGQYGNPVEPFMNTFGGYPVREAYAVGDVYDWIKFGFANIESGGVQNLEISVFGSVVARTSAFAWEVKDADESSIVGADQIHSEAVFSLPTLEHGASAAIGLGKNAVLTSVGLSGLPDVVMAPQHLIGGEDFWVTAISKSGTDVGSIDLQLDCNGAEITRALSAAISFDVDAAPTTSVAVGFVGASHEGDTSKTLTIDTGVADGDKVYLIALSGQFSSDPRLETFDGVTVDQFTFYKEGFECISFARVVVPSGGIKTFAFTGGGTVYRKSIHVWEIENWDLSGHFENRINTESGFDLGVESGGAIVAVALGRGSTSGAGIVGLATVDQSPTATELDFFVSANSQEFAADTVETISNDVNGSNVDRSLILAIKLSPA